MLLGPGGKRRFGSECVVVGNTGRETGCAKACPFLGLVGSGEREGLWMLGRGLRGRGVRRGGRVGEVAFVVVEAVGGMHVAVVADADIVVAIGDSVVGLDRVGAACRRAAWTVGSGMC